MNTKDLIRLGVPIKLAHEFIQNFIAQGNDGALLDAEIFNIVANPPAFFADELRALLARAIYRPAFTPRAELPLRRLRSERSAVGREALPRGAFAPWRQWGEGLEAEAVKQMANACALPSRPSASPRFSPPPPRRCARPFAVPHLSPPPPRRARSCRMRTSPPRNWPGITDGGVRYGVLSRWKYSGYRLCRMFSSFFTFSSSLAARYAWMALLSERGVISGWSMPVA